eukprot:403349316
MKLFFPNKNFALINLDQPVQSVQTFLQSPNIQQMLASNLDLSHGNDPNEHLLISEKGIQLQEISLEQYPGNNSEYIIAHLVHQDLYARIQDFINSFSKKDDYKEQFNNLTVSGIFGVDKAPGIQVYPLSDIIANNEAQLKQNSQQNKDDENLAQDQQSDQQQQNQADFIDKQMEEVKQDSQEQNVQEQIPLEQHLEEQIQPNADNQDQIPQPANPNPSAEISKELIDKAITKLKEKKLKTTQVQQQQVQNMMAQQYQDYGMMQNMQMSYAPIMDPNQQQPYYQDQMDQILAAQYIYQQQQMYQQQMLGGMPPHQQMMGAPIQQYNQPIQYSMQMQQQPMMVQNMNNQLSIQQQVQQQKLMSKSPMIQTKLSKIMNPPPAEAQQENPNPEEEIVEVVSQQDQQLTDEQQQAQLQNSKHPNKRSKKRIVMNQSDELKPDVQQKEIIIQDDTMISKLKHAVISFDMPPHLIALCLGLNVQIVRLIQYEASLPNQKPEKFIFPYRFITHKYNTNHMLLTRRLSQPVIDHFIRNIPRHKHMTYEERAQEQSSSKLNYATLRALYKQFNIPKQIYKEVTAQYNVPKRMTTSNQIIQLLALELADIKMKNKPLIYIDTVCITASELSLIISETDERSNLRNEKIDTTLGTVWVTIAIDCHLGIIGYQMYKEKPEQQQYIDFITKLNQKIHQVETEQCKLLMQEANLDLHDDGQVKQNNAALSANRQNEILKIVRNIQRQKKWIVLKSHYAKDCSKVNEVLIKAKFRVLPILNEEMNRRLNSAYGFWQYLAQHYEMKLTKKEFHQLQSSMVAENQPNKDPRHYLKPHISIQNYDEASIFLMSSLHERLAECVGEMSNKCIKAIANTYNNDEIMRYIDVERGINNGLLGNSLMVQPSNINSKVLTEKW